jgi:hypothetical protein
MIRVLDRFEVDGGVWSTESTRSPWSDELSAAAAFGEGVAGGTTSWQFELEPSGREGLLLVRQPSQSQLFIVAEGRAITPIRGGDAISRTSGVVRLGSSWHIGAPTSAGFSVFKLVGDQLKLLQSYPFEEDAARMVPQLVRNRNADALGILLDAQSKYIYPINLWDGSLQSPLMVTPAALASLPANCEADDSGFVFTDLVNIAPFVELMGEAGAVNASRVEARLSTLGQGVCVDSLAARASAVLPESLARAGTRAPARPPRAPVPMVLSEEGSASRRWHFNCYP